MPLHYHRIFQRVSNPDPPKLSKLRKVLSLHNEWSLFIAKLPFQKRESLKGKLVFVDSKQADQLVGNWSFGHGGSRVIRGVLGL